MNDEIICDGKSLINIFLGPFYLIMSIVLISMLFKYDMGLINCILGTILILFILGFSLYFFLKVFCFYFSINQEKIIYKNLFNKKYTYLISDIENCKLQYGRRGSSVIIITMKDSNKIKINGTDRNYKLLKTFLINNNLLDRKW